MNKLEVQQTGGFPLETDTLDFMQTTYRLLNELGFISGNNTIVSGCQQVGSNVSDGVVFYNGELLEFKGGAIQAQVRVFQTTETREFENGEVKGVYIKRWMGFGSSGGNILWSSFSRPKTTKELTEELALLSLLPVGVILMWAGAVNEIPPGWKLCDGTEGTPNLKGRFVVGYDGTDGDYDTIGTAGGYKTVTLTEAQMPEHTHTVEINADGEHTHNLKVSTLNSGISGGSYLSGGNTTYNASAETEMAGEHTHAATAGNAGGGQAHENRPPYYVIAFIQWKGIPS